MKRTEAMDRAIKKYEKEKIDRVMIRFPKGLKEIVQAHASERGESINSFVTRAVQETLAREERDTLQKQP